ncbi:sugar ABC transporter substrate-binding protein [Candidatus Bipolaricaulota bacterium]|nr:sugar ABC transporter substrate-binding protein [Candidatus Bipolaricaulota bacterium]
MSKITRLSAVFLLVFGLALAPAINPVQAEAETTLNVLLPIGGGYTIEDQEAIGEEFEETHPDIEVDMEFVGWANLFDNIVTSIGGGNAPDAMYIGSRWIPQLANMGAIIPLDEYLTEEKREMYPEKVWNTTTYQGDIYGVVRAMSSKALIYNKDLFREAGLDPEDPPETWDELHSYAEKIDNLGKNINGFGLAADKFTSTTSQFLNFLYANGGRVVNEEGEVVLDQPEAIEAMDFYANKLPEVSESSPMEWRREDLIKPFEDGKIGMYIDHVHNAKSASDSGIDVGIAFIPGGPAEGAPRSASVQVTDSIAIPAQSENKEEAWEFIKYMTSFDKQAEWDKKLGFIPPIKKEMELEAFDTWYWEPYLEITRKYAVGQPKLQNYTAGEEVILNAIQKVFLGRQSPEEALTAAASSIRSMEQ